MAKLRTIEIFEETANRLEIKAAERGITLEELITEIAYGIAEPSWSVGAREEGRAAPSPPIDDPDDARSWTEYQKDGIGVPWEEARAWMESWFTKDELPQPKPRKL